MQTSDSVTFKCPPPLRKAAEEKAEAELLSVSAWLRRLIKQAVEQVPRDRTSRNGDFPGGG